MLVFLYAVYDAMNVQGNAAVQLTACSRRCAVRHVLCLRAICHATGVHTPQRSLKGSQDMHLSCGRIRCHAYVRYGTRCSAQFATRALPYGVCWGCRGMRSAEAPLKHQICATLLHQGFWQALKAYWCDVRMPLVSPLAAGRAWHGPWHEQRPVSPRVRAHHPAVIVPAPVLLARVQGPWSWLCELPPRVLPSS